MIGIDTNVFIRYVVRDDEAQACKSDKIFASCSEESPILINQIVLVEIVWVLKRLYKYAKGDIINVLELILFNENILVLNSEEAKNAFVDYEKGQADFSDYFIAQLNKAQSCATTLTFDKLAAQSNGFSLIL